jgi:hypothetical protein
MREIYADFNDIDADGVLPLTCVGSTRSIAGLRVPLVDGEEVWLTDGELKVRANVSIAEQGWWEARSKWCFEPVR